MSNQNIPEHELKVLEEIARARGKTIKELLVELGKAEQEEDPVVEFSGQAVADPPAETPPESLPEAPVADFDPPPAEEEEEAPPEKESAAAVTMSNTCNQCGWDQSVPAMPEPEQQDKIAFLQAILGQKVFSKQMTALGGNLRITFRSLTGKEIDELYAEAFRAKSSGLIATATDYYELLNRLRVYLQIVSISSSKSALHISLPDGLTREANSAAVSCWKDFFSDKPIRDEDLSKKPTLMMRIQDYVLDEVLTTEHLQRIVTQKCNQFNQLVVKLEMCVDNPDFWKGIEPQF
jgi:hypothetical protein